MKDCNSVSNVGLQSDCALNSFLDILPLTSMSYEGYRVKNVVNVHFTYVCIRLCSFEKIAEGRRAIGNRAFSYIPRNVMNAVY